MAEQQDVILSPEGLRRLELELEHLKTVRRREIAEKIKRAREFGDLNENSEYEHVKNEQAFIEGRILTLERTLRSARLIDEQELDGKTVKVGSRVKLESLDDGEEADYVIVSSTEADPAANKISSLSPVGRAVMGKEVGATVEIKVPDGVIRYRILEIGRGF